jgi:hypothetical protein
MTQRGVSGFLLIIAASALAVGVLRGVALMWGM